MTVVNDEKHTLAGVVSKKQLGGVCEKVRIVYENGILPCYE